MKTLYNYIILILLLLILKNPLLSAQDSLSIDSIQNFIQTTANDTLKIKALINLSKKHQESNSIKSFNFGIQALKLSARIKYQKWEGESHNNLGDLYWYKGDYGSSFDHYLKALKIYESLKNPPAIADCYRNIGWIYNFQKNYNLALSYFYKAFDINNQWNRKKEMGQNYNDIGVVNTTSKNYKEALESYNNALKIYEAIDYKKGLAAIYGNVSIIYNTIGKPYLAIKNNEKAIKIAKEIGNRRYLAELYCDLGGSYLLAKRYKEAAISLQKSVDYSTEVNDKITLRNSYEKFSLLYSTQNNFEQAFKYLTLASTLAVDIYDESNTRQVNEMTTKYESEKKELMIDNLKKANLLSEEKLNSEKNLKIYLFLFCVLIAASAFVLFRSNIQKKKANQKLSLAYEEIEEKNKDITDSINYSKRIQDASLPSKELRFRLFPKAFILFKPKDIVSGDFYWYAEKDGKKLIACCDCTGHGVPGALMSMIGNNMLNQIVNEKRITSPEEILNHLHKEVRKALKQEEQTANKDGMDIALITFNSETEMDYAGANRPLWIVRTSNEKENNATTEIEKSSIFTAANAQLIEIKPDKFSIGGQQSESERKFTKHTITLSKGDNVYLFSDGFVDQFGGPEGKKYMSKRFKELLFANYTKPMNDQENILAKTMITWKANHDQVDDILVIGIKI